MITGGSDIVRQVCADRYPAPAEAVADKLGYIELHYIRIRDADIVKVSESLVEHRDQPAVYLDTLHLLCAGTQLTRQSTDAGTYLEHALSRLLGYPSGNGGADEKVLTELLLKLQPVRLHYRTDLTWICQIHIYYSLKIFRYALII